jgi:hypothetical protein
MCDYEPRFCGHWNRSGSDKISLSSIRACALILYRETWCVIAPCEVGFAPVRMRLSQNRPVRLLGRLGFEVANVLPLLLFFFSTGRRGVLWLQQARGGVRHLRRHLRLLLPPERRRPVLSVTGRVEGFSAQLVAVSRKAEAWFGHYVCAECGGSELAV